MGDTKSTNAAGGARASNEYSAFANTRVRRHEKRLIEAAAERDGYAFTSDWIRAQLREGIARAFGPLAVERSE